MDTVKSGKFIAQLRKETGLNQEQLGEKLGVTNKTVSRWETGTYLPPADVLLEMSTLFGVSINEILSGQRLEADEYRQAAEENLAEAIKESSFSRKEKEAYFKQKWLREHIAVMVLMGIAIIAVYIFGFIKREPLIGNIAVLMFIFAHGWRNNAMMAYVERHIYD